jgi:hypothetical protein
MSLVYNGLEVPLTESSINVCGRNPYLIRFKGAFRSSVMVPFLIDALHRRIKPHNVNGVRIKHAKFEDIKIHFYVHNYVEIEVVERVNKIITDKPLLEHVSWNNEPALVSNMRVIDQNGEKIKSKGFTINLCNSEQSTIVFNEPQSEDITEIRIFLHSPCGSILTASMIFGITYTYNSNKREFNIHTIEQVNLNMIGEPMGLYLGIKTG